MPGAIPFWPIAGAAMSSRIGIVAQSLSALPEDGLLQAWGDVETLVYPLAAVKLLQALPLVESGVADHYKRRRR